MLPPLCARVSCGVLLGVVDDVDACMYGPAFDGIRVAPDSLVQSFTEYHDNSYARLTALRNSRVGRGPHGRGGTKRATTGSLVELGLFGLCIYLLRFMALSLSACF